MGLVWQSELAAQPLEVSFSHEFNFVSCFAPRMKQRKDILRSPISRSWSAVLSVPELEQAMWSSGITDREIFCVLKHTFCAESRTKAEFKYLGGAPSH